MQAQTLIIERLHTSRHAKLNIHNAQVNIKIYIHVHVCGS